MKLLLLLSLSFCTLCVADEYVRYVDRDVSGGLGNGRDLDNAYSSLSALEIAEETDLTEDTNNLVVYLTASSGTEDETSVYWDEWTMSADYDVTLIGDGSYTLHNNDTDDTAFRLRDTHITFIGINFKVTATGSSDRYCFFSSGFPAGSWLIDSCTFEGVSSSSGSVYGIYQTDPDGTNLTVVNSIFTGFVNSTDDEHGGICNTAGTPSIYNCTFYGNRFGTIGSFSAITNCIAGNNSNADFGTTTNVTYCCSDDKSGSDAQGPIGGDWTNEMTSPSTGDFTLVVDGNCVGNGTDDPGSGLYDDDIEGTARSSTWDIGAYEYVAPAAGGTTITTGAVQRRLRSEYLLLLLPLTIPFIRRRKK